MPQDRIRGPRGQVYRIAVLLVTARDDKGRPKEAKIFYPGQSVKLEGGEEFVTAYLPEKVFKSN